MHRFVSRRRPSRRRRTGLTLVEMLVAAAITLIMMVAIVRIFGTISEAVAIGRATIEMSGQMRSVTHTLQEDLDGVTIPALPWARAGRGGGYLEVIDGTANPWDGSDGPMTWIGDVDDILAFTARSKGEPFTGRFYNTTTSTYEVHESQVAEIIWWAEFIPGRDIDYNSDGLWNRQDTDGDYVDDRQDTRTLFRRVLLVRPDFDLTNYDTSRCDISVGFDGSTPNSLADLTLRQNRYARGATFPYEFNRTVLQDTTVNRVGDNVVLNNCLAFDARAFDPKVTIGGSNVQGAYVHLNYKIWPPFPPPPPPQPPPPPPQPSVRGATWFSGPPHAKSGLNRPTDMPTYDTWPFFYERDGVNQDGDSSTDEGTDGLDEGGEFGTDGIDDVAERETSPPYPRPLRGLQIRLRMIERSSEKIRPATIVCDFVPE